MRHIRLTVGDLVLTGILEFERAPATCAAFAKLLPLRARLIQARWSGEAAWVPLGDLDASIGRENLVHRPLPGQILFYPVGESETEILVPYGLTAFAAKTGPLSGNHFLTIADSDEQLKEIGRRVLWEGAQDIEFSEG
jgi:Protein of unknown function (DUF3830)